MDKKMTKNRFPAWKKLTLSALAAVTVMPVWPAAASQSQDRVKEVLELLSGTHVSGITEEALSDTAVKAMVEAVHDPYTQYMNKEEWDRFRNGLSRSYVGIGVQISPSKDGIFIEQVFEGSPAAGADLRKDDRIIRVNDIDITDQTTDQLVSMIMGEENTKVTITVLRDGEQVAKTLVRKPITLPVLESAYMDGGVGYLKLYSFSEDADEKFAAKLQEFKTRSGFRSLVVDLRNNPGGLLDSARNIASLFVKDGILIHTRDRNGEDSPVVIRDGSALSVPVYVLVNENSASASEVLSGALQDYGAATIAGTQTYGKGSVQNIYTLSDGSMLKVTIEEYLTPKGKEVNHKGISPDIAFEGDLNQLLSVLRLAGVGEFHLTKERSMLQVNGFKVSDPLPVFESDGHLWIHSRVLAALAGTEIRWLPETESVELKVSGAEGDGKMFGPQTGDARFEEGRLFIDANAFAREFPELTVRGDVNKLELSYKKGQ